MNHLWSPGAINMGKVSIDHRRCADDVMLPKSAMDLAMVIMCQELLMLKWLISSLINIYVLVTDFSVVIECVNYTLRLDDGHILPIGSFKGRYGPR